MNTIKSEWEKFERECLEDVSDQQRREAYVSFYSGVIAIFYLQDRLIANSSGPLEITAALKSWAQELGIFAEDQKAKITTITH